MPACKTQTIHQRVDNEAVGDLRKIFWKALYINRKTSLYLVEQRNVWCRFCLKEFIKMHSYYIYWNCDISIYAAYLKPLSNYSLLLSFIKCIFPTFEKLPNNILPVKDHFTSQANYKYSFQLHYNGKLLHSNLIIKTLLSN